MYPRKATMTWCLYHRPSHPMQSDGSPDRSSRLETLLRLPSIAHTSARACPDRSVIGAQQISLHPDVPQRRALSPSASLVSLLPLAIHITQARGHRSDNRPRRISTLSLLTNTPPLRTERRQLMRSRINPRSGASAWPLPFSHVLACGAST